MVWIGPSKLRCVAPPTARTSPARRSSTISSRILHAVLARDPFRIRAQQISLRHHLQNRPHILRHAAVHQHQALLQTRPRLRADFGVIENAMIRQQPAAADAELRIALGCEHALNQLDARPDAARVLPSAAGTAQPLAENRARRNQPPLRLPSSCAGQRLQPAPSRACKRRSVTPAALVETASREPLGMLFTWLTISMPKPVALHQLRRERCASGWPEPSRPGGTMPDAITAAFSSPR